MTRSSQLLLIVAVLALGIAAAVLVRERTVAPPAPASSATAAPATSADYARIPKAAPAAAPAGRSEEHNRALALAVEGALVSRDMSRLESAFAASLPELIAADAGKVTAIFARQQPGEARDLLRDELARQWVRHDRDSAIAWMKSLEDKAEREAAATTAMRSIAAADPAQAVIVADELGVGRDDGSLEHIVQIWAVEDPEAAARWIDAQPTDAFTAQLRSRIEPAIGRRTTPR